MNQFADDLGDNPCHPADQGDHLCVLAERGLEGSRRFSVPPVPRVPRLDEGSLHIQYQLYKCPEFTKLVNACWEEARKAQDEAAAEIAVAQVSLHEAINYFRGKTTLSKTMNPNGLLVGPKMDGYGSRMDALMKQAEEQQQKLKESGANLKSTLGDLKKLGGDAQQVGQLVENIPALNRYGTAISQVGSV
ncbi:hypothetical protein, partial [Actinomadura sp. RB99]|uniref:hypothetical protein n=1 Tax=Actinomadura sp. RB99 TaxID=2691577 RepID=UPI0016829C64